MVNSHNEHHHQHEGLEHSHATHCHPGEDGGGTILAIRPYSGLSGDILLTGLATLCLEKEQIRPGSEQAGQWLEEQLAKVAPELVKAVKIATKLVGGIAGWHAYVDLPASHEHRSPGDIAELISASSLSESAKKMALGCFSLLAECEAQAHGITPPEVHFHEVGALDSILDICGACEFYHLLEAPAIICGPLPIGDGHVHCQHGLLPAPAPAALMLLKGLATRPFAGSGETVTPTAAALLHALNARFGSWPHMLVEHTALVYGSKTFPDAANGVAFALGKSWREIAAAK